ncbi:caspase family protein [Rhizobium gallicum]|uniref:caspase family protein n=1 Tax=Rhizobium gallicum TaxID=56730 RepID=UPI001EF9362D|nr:caspase family protein [Rhizobium gallicum]ULJ76495.1 caspase domain-containing protein [Rhizobium gallicum]
MQCLRIALTILLVLMCSQALAEKRVALVIGNSAYQHVPMLPNPGNDAGDMAAKLRDLGFEVVVGSDLDLAGVRRTIGDFVSSLDGADIALFYYAGHGLQVNGENYIAPVDAKLLSYIDLEFEAVPMDLILSAMERTTRVNLVFLDACRDNPLAVNLARSMGTRSFSVGRGLAKVGSGVGSLIAFATQPGNVALDGEGRNSPFTAALLRHLGKPGRDITRELIDVRRDVLQATHGKQVPWDNSSLTGEVVLKPLAKLGPAIADTGRTDNAAELAFWDTIKASTDRDFFDAYLQQYPNGLFVSLAKAKIRIIERAAAEQPAAEAKAAGTVQQPAGADVDLSTAEKQLAALATPSTGGATPDAGAPDRELVRSIQKELNRVGCGAGNEDGLWGDGSRRALGQFARRSKVELAALEPSGDVLERLRTQKSRICPLVCAQNQQERNGRCAEIKAPAKRTLQNAITPPTAPPKTFGNCPADAHIAARETFSRGTGRGRTFRTATHSCGRGLICRRAARGMQWHCNWS